MSKCVIKKTLEGIAEAIKEAKPGSVALKVLEQYKEDLQKLAADRGIKPDTLYVKVTKQKIEALDHNKQLRYSAAVTKFVKDIFNPSVNTNDRLWFSGALAGIVGGTYSQKSNTVTVGIKPSIQVIDDIVNETILSRYFDYAGDTLDELPAEKLAEHLANDKKFKEMQKETPALVEDLKALVEQMDDTAKTHALTHEFVHAATVEYVRSNPNSPITKRLNELFEKAKSPTVRSRLLKYVNTVRDEVYWDQSLEEFVAEALSNPALMVGMMRVNVTLGDKLSNMFMEFITTVMRILGVKKNDTMFEYMLDAFAAIAEAKVADTVNERRSPIIVKTDIAVTTYEELLNELIDKTAPELGQRLEERKFDSVSKAAKSLPKQYYTQLNRLVKRIVGPKVTTDQYLAFVESTLENIAIVGGRYAKGKITLSKKPNQTALEMEAAGLFDQWYVDESPYATSYQNMEPQELIDALAKDEVYKRLKEPMTAKTAARMMTEWGKANGMHTLAHEMVHAGSVEFMKTNPEHEYTKRVEELYKEALDNKERVLRLMGKGANEYWTTSKEKFVAEGLSNPDLVFALKNLRTEKRDRLTNMFKDLVNILLKMIKADNKANVYSYLLDGYIAMIESKAKPQAANEIIDDAREMMRSEAKAETKVKDGTMTTKEQQEASRLLAEAGLDATTIVASIKNDIEGCS